jgi:hypothetical protein
MIFISKLGLGVLILDKAGEHIEFDSMLHWC